MSSTDTTSELRQKLAAIEHERWSDWQAWFFSKCEQMLTGADKIGLKVPQGYVDHLQHQIETPYSELSESEKASDMEQVDRYWPLIEEYMKAVQQQLLTELMSHAEQQQIIVAYEKTFEHKPILQDWRAVPIEILEAKLQQLHNGEKK